MSRRILAPSRPAGAGRRSGFTLVEVLVSLLIVSGLMLAITQMLEAARLSRDTIHNIQETQLAGPAILDLVERDLRGLVTADRDPAGVLRVQNRVVYGLDADSVDFATTTDGLVPVEVGHRFLRADVNEVGYRLRPNPSDDDLLEIYRRESFGLDDDPFEGGSFTFLHDRVRHFDVQVYTEDGVDAEPLEEWGMGSDSQGVPARIEITLVLELAPRILREQLAIATIDKRTVTYKRVLRMSEGLRQAQALSPVPVVPVIEKPALQDEPAGGQEGGGGTGGGGGGEGRGDTGTRSR